MLGITSTMEGMCRFCNLCTCKSDNLCMTDWLNDWMNKWITGWLRFYIAVVTARRGCVRLLYVYTEHSVVFNSRKRLRPKTKFPKYVSNLEIFTIKFVQLPYSVIDFAFIVFSIEIARLNHEIFISLHILFVYLMLGLFPLQPIRL